jgi:hypothetical protein
VPALEQIALDLKETNRRVDFWMNSFCLPATASGTRPRVVSPQQINGLLSELMKAGESLQKLPAEVDDSIRVEVDAYRKKIECLRDLLPTIHRSLLQERARLEHERGRMQAASQWASMTHQTR